MEQKLIIYVLRSMENTSLHAKKTIYCVCFHENGNVQKMSTTHHTAFYQFYIKLTLARDNDSRKNAVQKPHCFATMFWKLFYLDLLQENVISIACVCMRVNV